MVITPYKKELQGAGEGPVSPEVQGYNFLNIPQSTEHAHLKNILKLLVNYAMTQNWHTTPLKPKDMLLV